jgi:hypothetical protein
LLIYSADRVKIGHIDISSDMAKSRVAKRKASGRNRQLKVQKSCQLPVELTNFFF